MFARYLRRTSFGRFASCTFMSCNTSFCAIWSSVNFFAMIEADADADRALLELLVAPLFLATIVTLRGSYARNWGVAAAVGFFTLSLFTKIVKKNFLISATTRNKNHQGPPPTGAHTSNCNTIQFCVGVVSWCRRRGSSRPKHCCVRAVFVLCSCCVVLCCSVLRCVVLVVRQFWCARSTRPHPAPQIMQQRAPTPRQQRCLSTRSIVA